MRRLTVRVGTDNGVRVAVLSGLKADDLVVAHPSDALRDGMAVTANLPDEGTK